MTRWTVVSKGGYWQMRCARTSGPQYSSTMGSELARFSTKPVRTIASLVKGRGDQIVANGVGQTAVEGAPASWRSLPKWRTRRRDVVTSSQPPRAVSRCSVPLQRQCSEGQRRRFGVEMHTAPSQCLDRAIRPAPQPSQSTAAGDGALFGLRHLEGAAGALVGSPGQATMHRRSALPGDA